MERKIVVYISENAPETVKSYISGIGHKINHIPPGIAAGTVASHADLYVCRIGGQLIKASACELGKDYPENAAFCAAIVGKYFIHNLKITSPRLLEAAKLAGLEPVHVRQGYTKCSCVIVGGRGVITSDKGIARVLHTISDIDVLEVTEGHVCLPGYDYGFIGGASGQVGDEIIFCGDITAHPDFERIRDFIVSYNIRIKWFDFPLLDIGSIIEA